MHHPGAGAHPLQVAGPDHSAAAGRVLVLERAGEHAGEDLHVAVRVRAESLGGLDGIVVDHPQRAEAHLIRVVMLPERKGVSGIEPSGAGVKSFAGLAQRDHRMLRCYVSPMIKIQYCNSWGYKPRAVRAAAALSKELGIEAELEVGAPGSFIVLMDGDVVAEKRVGFPSEEEIVSAVRKKMQKA